MVTTRFPGRDVDVIRPQLGDANIVVLAQTHNPTISSRDWLCSKGVFSPDDFQGDFEKRFVHTPAFATCETPHFRFFVDESRLQMGVKLEADEDFLGSLVEKVQCYVQSLPETRYTAVGFNFVHNVEFGAAEERLAFANKRLGKDAIASVMGLRQGPFEIGAILVWWEQNGRVRAVVEPKAGEEESYLLQTNVHQVVGKDVDPIEAIVAHLQRFDAYREDIESRLSDLFNQ